MKQLLLVLTTVIVSFETSLAQNISTLTSENTIVAGTEYRKLEDRFILPFSVAGSTTSIGYNFIKTNAARKVNISGDWSFGSLSARYANVKVHSLDLRFSQGFSLLKSNNGKLNSYWGYGIETTPSFVHASYKDETRDSWTTFNNLSLYQSLVYTSGRNKLVWDVSLPLIGAASRPPVKSSYYNTTNGLMYDSYSNLFLTTWKNHHAVSSAIDCYGQLEQSCDCLDPDAHMTRS